MTFFAELSKIQDYYYEWRRKHKNQPVIDGSPALMKVPPNILIQSNSNVINNIFYTITGHAIPSKVQHST